MSKLWLIGLAASAAWTGAAAAEAPPRPPMPPLPPQLHGGHPLPIKPGTILPPAFMNQQFVIHDWRAFGFPPPMPGGRWVRHHDDALLIDHEGRVVHSLPGRDWDDRDEGEDFAAYDEEEGYGPPHQGDDEDDFHGPPPHGDDDRGPRGHHGMGYGKDWGDGHGKCHRPRRSERICRSLVRRTMPGAPHPGFGYGYGYGYGYGHGQNCGCGSVVITETTTTTYPAVETRTYYETVKPAKRRYAKPVYRRPAPARRVFVKPAPRPGERG